jgi:hypothetical protein
LPFFLFLGAILFWGKVEGCGVVTDAMSIRGFYVSRRQVKSGG